MPGRGATAPERTGRGRGPLEPVAGPCCGSDAQSAALTSHEDLEQLRRQPQSVAVNCNDKALAGGGRGGRCRAAPRAPRTSRLVVTEVQAEQPLHGVLRGENSR